jgi:hypothetical protein
LETKESVVTARLLKAGFMLACAMGVTAMSAPVLAADMCRPIKESCDCACPAPARAAYAPRVRAAGKAYAERYYDYRSASYVDSRDLHGEWEAAPNDGYVALPPVAYAPPPAAYYPPPPDYYAPPPGYYGPPPEVYGSVDDRGFTGGVGYGADGGGGGGGGGYGQVFFADGGLGMNGYGNGQPNPSSGAVQGYAGKALYAVQNPPSSSK